MEYMVVPCFFPKSVVTDVHPSVLPWFWKTWPGPPELRRIGDEWLDSRKSAVMCVPSAVIDFERNFIINPEHPDFAQIEIDPPRPFRLDMRLILK